MRRNSSKQVVSLPVGYAWAVKTAGPLRFLTVPGGGSEVQRLAMSKVVLDVSMSLEGRSSPARPANAKSAIGSGADIIGSAYEVAV